MTLVKMNNKNQLNTLPKVLNTAEITVSLDQTKDLQNEQKEIIRRLRIQNKKLLEQLTAERTKLKQRNTEKTEALNKVSQIEQLNYHLSQALGSCDSCWGQDTNCSTCRGDGISGWRKINKRLFNVYVLPALEKLYGLSKKLNKNNDR